MAKIERDSAVRRVLEQHVILQAQMTLNMLGDTQPLVDAIEELAEKVKKKEKRRRGKYS